ncbi:hypothetical protein Ahy_B09g098226 [Arachis hypogaea]|uniref:Reverse transcriptase zinc-binding domain-containing protein n=1 Tax=Arachis hypogaea TaxID=3818 RepID=A0A444XQR2_ARAHY|nr:hypothetical protein Ahy_B09g098226 [Arachis hypogaea]
MVTQEETADLHVKEVSIDTNRGLSIREELNRLFGKKGSLQNHQLNVGMIQSTGRGTASMSQVAEQLWSYREKPKAKQIVNASARTVGQRVESMQKYFVELPEDQQGMDEVCIAKTRQRNEFTWVLELAYNLVGLHPKPSSQIESFRNFVHENAVLDLELQGMQFTWFSNPRNGCVTKERLDRVLANWEWRRAFQHATLLALPPVSSDHTPLVLNINPRGHRSKNFKFEAFWVDHADCDSIIRRGWSSSGNTGVDTWTNLNRRAQDCKEELIKWSRDNKLKLYFDGASIDKILRTLVSLFGREDSFCWPFRSDGIYTIKTGYHVARNERRIQNNNPSTSEDLKSLWQEVWNLKAPKKIRTFLWRASHNILPIFGNLFHKIITNTPMCPICLQEPETTEHALLLCPWTRAA